jgi:hypothetical protein
LAKQTVFVGGNLAFEFHHSGVGHLEPKAVLLPTAILMAPSGSAEEVGQTEVALDA